jgi:hypothetical protein
MILMSKRNDQFFHLVPVKFDPLPDHPVAISTAAVYLRPVSNSRLHPMPLLNERDMFSKDIIVSSYTGRRSDNRHFTAENIDEQRKAIDAGSAQDGTNTRQILKYLSMPPDHGRSKF